MQYTATQPTHSSGTGDTPMSEQQPNHRKALQAWYQRRSRVGRWMVWCLSGLLIGRGLAFGSGFFGGLGQLLLLCSGLPLVFLFPLVVYRWLRDRLLWKVRNRLILICVLMGLAPLVTFLTLGGVALYLLAGQFSTTLMLSDLDLASTEVLDETISGAALRLPGHVQHQVTVRGEGEPQDSSPISIAVLEGTTWKPLVRGVTTSDEQEALPAAGVPGWLHAPFHGIVQSGRKLYICSEVVVPNGTTPVTVLGSRPLDGAQLRKMTHGLGSVTLFSGFGASPDQTKKHQRESGTDTKDGELDGGFETLKGSSLPERERVIDPPVFFSSPAPVVQWTTGETVPAMVSVISRPGLLYRRLFATSVEAGTVVFWILVVSASVLGLMELFALFLAVRLSHTITRSVADLYRGTEEIDAGHLGHRIQVLRKDQFGALSASFNRMAASISDLLLQQREKEKLLSELAIAQEVQTTLFPPSPATLPKFEMHAVCVPARSVGGDYFDFIFGPGSSLCLALGDISGKGISAALLMASLHSAVRAFSLTDEQSPAFPPPSALLKSLNEHLIRSTVAARYATMFVASYDSEAQTLTYSTGGHPPPLLFSKNGGVKRLDCGGSVVGLIENLEYEQATVHMERGDLLVAYTDGITEPENSDVEFGEERLRQLIELHKGQPLSQLASETLGAVRQWIGDREQPDDMTLLFARQL